MRSRASTALAKFACAFLVSLATLAPGSLAQPEEASAAALRFYGEYMGMGVALKPLSERWFTARFRGAVDAFHQSANMAVQTEGNPILPWKNWDSSWRHKLKAEALQDVSRPGSNRCYLCYRRKWSPDCPAGPPRMGGRWLAGGQRDRSTALGGHSTAWTCVVKSPTLALKAPGA